MSATTTTTPFKILKNRDLQVRSDLSGIAAMTAAAGSGINYDQNAAATAVTSDASYSSNPITAQITMVASNSADNDIWLRTDGGNQMHAPLRFDSAIDGNREIIGVSRIQNLSAQILHLGSPSGVAAASGAGLIVDTDSEIIGNLRIIKELKVDNGASVTGSVSATANVVAQQNVVAGQASSAQIFYDANNSSYYVDPDKVSNLNSLAANYISSKGRLRTEEYLELGGVATPGKGCSPNGLLGRTPDGKPLSCESGTWRRLEGGLDGPYQVSGTYLGNWKLCTLNYTSGNSKQVYYDGSQWIWKGSGTQLVYCYK
ncbi:shufflon system plasmid conjugative transfer pilus tip adhesin PilV [Pseudomonas sp. Leaf58]|uniref:shufflon system plasmid conjugative transfer pilus tip adhesin PilV n=1 Tax=Pseudomonas sp. Leaf58 TaxID=1736226 RepID=UPI0013C4D386|nr:shufflon system plasmid conjugative transfer pilus tip adhesin PilV [Pseudomonas sp. Leaf58]